MGIATWLRCRHVGGLVGFNLFGVQMSGEFDQTCSVRKLIASFLMSFPDRSPPGIAANLTLGLRRDLRGVAVMGGGTGLGHAGACRLMAGTLPGMLLRVKRTCKRGVVFNIRLLVGLGAAMMGGAFVMRCREDGVVTLCSGGVIVTLCSAAALGVSGGNRCGSSSGSIHSWRGCVATSLDGGSRWLVSFALSKVSTFLCLVAVIVFRVVTVSFVNPLKCSPVVRHGT